MAENTEKKVTNMPLEKYWDYWRNPSINLDLRSAVTDFLRTNKVEPLVNQLSLIRRKILELEQRKYKYPTLELEEFCKWAGLTLHPLDKMYNVNERTHELLDHLGKLNPCQGRFSLAMVRKLEVFAGFEPCVHFLVFHDNERIEIVGLAWVIQFFRTTFTQFSGEDISSSKIHGFREVDLEFISMPYLPPRFKKFFEYFEQYWVLGEGFYKVKKEAKKDDDVKRNDYWDSSSRSNFYRKYEVTKND